MCLPHLSFSTYFPASRDRAGLELAERPPSRSVREAVACAGGGWVAASAYESEGEGVFYATAYLGGPEVLVASSRQRVLATGAGRFEPMFFSPGHQPVRAADLPLGRTVALLAADLRTAAVWADLPADVCCVIGGASDAPPEWERTRRVAAGMAAVHGVTVLIANRAGDGLAGGGAAFRPDGTPLPSDEGGLYEL